MVLKAVPGVNAHIPFALTRFTHQATCPRRTLYIKEHEKNGRRRNFLLGKSRI